MEKVAVVGICMLIALFILLFANSLKNNGVNKYVVEFLYWMSGIIGFSAIMLLFSGD